MKKIMYIGKKATKTDNVNAVPSRIWRGLGDVIEVHDLEAAKLCVPGFDAIWRDVTGLKPDDIKALIGTFQEQFRVEARKQAELNKTLPNLGVATTDELLQELERRQALQGTPERSTGPVQGAGPSGKRHEATEGERPKTTDSLLSDIVKAISMLNPEDKTHYDGQGRPSIEVIRSLVGYNVSQSELDHAVKMVKEME